MLQETGTAADPIQEIEERLENIRRIFLIAEDLRHAAELGRWTLDGNEGPLSDHGCVSLFGLIREAAGRIEDFEEELAEISSRLDNLKELQNHSRG